MSEESVPDEPEELGELVEPDMSMSEPEDGSGLLVTVQVIFWTKTQPANSFWLEETELSRSATRFFQTGRGNTPRDWVAARDQWERSHLLRAVAATLGLFLLTLAVAL